MVYIIYVGKLMIYYFFLYLTFTFTFLEVFCVSFYILLKTYNK